LLEYAKAIRVEINLPDGDGLRLARELRDRRGDLGIVILTSRDEDDVLFRALETGASAFVASGLAIALTRRREATGRLVLSSREMEVLRLLRDGLSVPAIAVRMFISYSTAKTYVGRLYQKLGATNRAQALMAAVQHGLLTFEPSEPVSVPPDRAAAAAGL
jgi:DNA-binding NarL/FixJ family response regulator